MRKRSCLVQLILLGIIVGVLALAIRQAFTRRLGVGAEPVASAVTASVEPTTLVEATVRIAPAPAPAAVAGVVEQPLTLAGSRPVMLTEGYPVGLAVAGEWLYLAGQREADGGAFVARVALSDYGVSDVVTLPLAPGFAPGGMAAGPDAVWLALGGADAGALLALDGATLTPLRSVAAPVPVRAVAVWPEGELYASRCAPGELLHLSAEGAVLARRAAPDDACYTDLAYVAGQLVGVATIYGEGVLDVLTPDDLSLVARHPLALTSARGNPVAGNAFDAAGGLFYFAPDRTANPVIMAYAPRDGDLSRVIP